MEITKVVLWVDSEGYIPTFEIDGMLMPMIATDPEQEDFLRPVVREMRKQGIVLRAKHFVPTQEVH